MPINPDREVRVSCPNCKAHNLVSYNLLEAGLEVCTVCLSPLPSDQTVSLPESGARSPF